MSFKIQDCLYPAQKLTIAAKNIDPENMDSGFIPYASRYTLARIVTCIVVPIGLVELTAKFAIACFGRIQCDLIFDHQKTSKLPFDTLEHIVGNAFFCLNPTKAKDWYLSNKLEYEGLFFNGLIDRWEVLSKNSGFPNFLYLESNRIKVVVFVSLEAIGRVFKLICWYAPHCAFLKIQEHINTNIGIADAQRKTYKRISKNHVRLSLCAYYVLGAFMNLFLNQNAGLNKPI
jgi:hypothetical protein